MVFFTINFSKVIMSVKIRLARQGSKNRPYYRIVIADIRSPRDGKFIEKIGHYDPLLNVEKATEKAVIDLERLQYWISVGAKPTATVQRLVNKNYAIDNEKINKASKLEA